MANKIENKQHTPVDHPSHYCQGKIEVIDYIRDSLGEDGCYDFCIGNVIKYVARAKHKGKWVQDLEKSIWYLKYALEIAKKDGSNLEIKE